MVVVGSVRRVQKSFTGQKLFLKQFSHAAEPDEPNPAKMHEPLDDPCEISKFTPVDALLFIMIVRKVSTLDHA